MSERTPPASFPDPLSALALPPYRLPDYFSSLASPSHFNLLTPSTRARLCVALYAVALDPSSPVRSVFLPPAESPSSLSVSDEWSLASAQAEALSSTSSSSFPGGDEYAPSRRGKPCGHVFRAGESVYRCRDCGLDPTCVLCAKCFHGSSHSREGHDVTVSTHAGVGAGCCDCGDGEAWREGRQRDCRYHGVEGVEQQEGEGAKGKETTDPLVEEAKHRIRATLSFALDWSLSVLERSPATFKPPRSAADLLNPASKYGEYVPEEEQAPPPEERGVVVSGLEGMDEEGLQRLAGQIRAFRRAGATVVAEEGEGGNAPGGGDDEDEDVPEADEDDAATILERLRRTQQRIRETHAEMEADLVERAREEHLARLRREGEAMPEALRQANRTGLTRNLELMDVGRQQQQGQQEQQQGQQEQQQEQQQPPSLPGSFPSSSSASHPLASSAASSPPQSFSLLLWNDERHSFTEVIDTVSRHVGCSRRAASDVAQRVDTTGRDVVLTSTDAEAVVKAAKGIAGIELAVTVRRSEDAWEEQVAGFIIGSFARDLVRARVGGEQGGLAELVAEVWLVKEGDEDASRWMRLAGVEARLWKGLRKEVQEMSVGMMGVSSEIRAELGLQYASIYPSLAQSYLLTDREPEHSLIFFGVQVFTVPSISALLLSPPHNFLSTLLQLLYSFFTGQLTPSKRRLVLPPVPCSSEQHPEIAVDLDHNPHLKQRRHFQLFSDLSHLVSSPSAHLSLLSSSNAMEDFSTFLSLFSNLNPQTRAVGTHVEYESESWLHAFNVAIQLSRAAKGVGEAYARASGEQLVVGLREVLRRVEEEEAGGREMHEVVLEPSSEEEEEEGEGGKSTYETVEYVVARRPASYHHPLSWLWAEMAKYVTSAGREGEGEGEGEGEARFGVEGWREVLGGFEGGEEEGWRVFVRGMEGALRTVALVAQVRSGVWVRNGLGIRAQNLHYRETSLRENTYDQNLFFLQTALVVLDPAQVVASILDRFDLVDWLTLPSPSPSFPSADLDPLAFTHPTYEPDQALSMMDELLNLLLTLFTDPVHSVPLSPLATLKRELIHILALGPSVYSDLLRHLSDRFSDDPNIDRLLAQVARFKPPSGSTDQGTYTLRDEFLREVDPYFARYSRNQREEAERVVRAAMRREKKGERARGKAYRDEPVVLPPRLPVSPRFSGPFTLLPRAFGARPTLLVVLYALRAATQRGAKLFSEQVVDLALQLALVCAVEQPEALASFAVERVGGTSLVEVLVRVEEDDRLEAVWYKAAWVLDRLEDAHGDVVNGLRKKEAEEEEEGGKGAAQVEMEEKRAAAKRRQEEIMRKFQERQKAFLANVEDEEDDDEDEEGDGEDGEAMMKEAPPAPKPRTNFGSCIVCQDDLDEAAPFGMLALVQGSNLVRLTPAGESNAPFQEEILSLPPSLDRDASHLRPYGTASHKLPIGGFTAADSTDGLARGFPQSQKAGLHASSCGHLMHLACFERYCRSLEQRHQQQPTRKHPETLERREFTCPLCKSLGNVLLPAGVESTAFLPYSGTFDRRSLADWGRPDADPLDDSSDLAGDEKGSSLNRFDESFLHRVDKLSLLNDLDHSSSFKPWRATMALPMLLPAHFGEGEGRMTARLLQVLTALKTELGGPGSSVASLSKDLVGYTVSTLEIASRGTAEPAWLVSESNARLLQSLVGVMQALAELMTQSVESARIAAVSVRQRLGGVFAQGSKFEPVEFTAFDPLGDVIEAGACMPSAFYHVVAVAFYSALAQNYLAVYRLLHQSASVSDWPGDSSSAEAAEYLSLEAVRAFFPPESSPALFDPGRHEFCLTIGKHLHAQMLVFLRRAAIVARVVLGEPSEDATDAFMDEEDHSEFSRLVEFLRIPPPSTVLDPSTASSTDPTIQTLRAHLHACRESISLSVLYPVPSGSSSPSSFSLEPAVDRLLNASSVPDLEHPTIYELLGLPHQLDTLVAALLERRCKRCETVPSQPALCLFCGETVCAQSFCCMVGEEEAVNGECNEHMWTCGGSTGLYYLIKRNAILFLHTDKGAFSTPPYLDSHGEVDVGGRRIRSQFPQYLHRGRYDELRKLWLTGAIPTFVSRKLEATTDRGGWTTF
ncbi:hypothetical protein JCM8547_005859 [Rhodosporidiobolus lusitaniae]